MSELVRKVLLTRGEYDIEYVQWCQWGDCLLEGPVVQVRQRDTGGCVVLFHTRRLFRPGRTTLEVIGLAFDWILEQEAEEKRAKQEAEIATEQAAALAEFAADLNREATAAPPAVAQAEPTRFTVKERDGLPRPVSRWDVGYPATLPIASCWREVEANQVAAALNAVAKTDSEAP
jgi:hypothetical protein